MACNASEDDIVSSGNGGRGNITLAGLSGNRLSAGDWLAERLERKGTLGTPKGDQKSGDTVLLQGGLQISPSEVVDLKRSILGRLGSRQLNIMLELAGDNISDEREWELWDELEALGNQREVVRAIKFN